MIYRTLVHDGGATVSVEDETGILFTTEVSGKDAARILIKRIARDGVPVVEPEVARKKKAK